LERIDLKQKMVGSLLIRADVKYRHAVSKILEPYQLTVLQFETMRLLDQNGQIIGTKFIKDNLTNPDIAISNVLDELSAREIIIKNRALSNRRKVEIRLTPLGKLIIDTIEENPPETYLLGKMKKEELEQLKLLLTKIMKILDCD
jgi:DNA-binding MarR family transcriptional regulator